MRTIQKSRKLILGSTFFPVPRPLPLYPPLLDPLPLPLPPKRLKNDLPYFISTSEWSNSSQRMQPVYNVSPFSKGVVFLLKSTSKIVESHSGHRSRVVEIWWAPSGSKTRKLHILQQSRHLGALTGSRTSVPLHSGQAQTPWAIKECRHVGCGHRKHGIPAPFPSWLDGPDFTAPKSVSIPSKGGLL